MTDERFLRRAIELSRQGMESGQSPFGAVVVRDGAVVGEAHNTVWRDGDPTAHAEVNALRAAAARLGTIDLTGCAIYSSCEPCPMCLSAIHWARISVLRYAARIADAAAAGFREMPIPAERMKELGASAFRIDPPLLCDEAAEVLRDFARRFPERLY